MKNFTYKDEGAAVVYAHSNGGSVSAIIEWVRPGLSVGLRYAVPFGGEKTTLVPKCHWDRLTVFPRNSMFLVT